MTTEEALARLATSTTEAAARVLRLFCPDGVEVGPLSIVPQGTPSLAGIRLPAVTTGVSYVDGISGGNVFVMTRAGARRLAAVMMGQDPAAVEDGELSDLELSAVGEAMNQMMAAAAAATSTVLEDEVQISPPETRLVTVDGDVQDAYETTPYATRTSLSVAGEPCQFVQLVPTAFVVRMTRALADLAARQAGESSRTERQPVGNASESIRRVALRVSAELGRAQMPIGRAVRLWRGAVLELDRSADAPLAVMVNGYPFALGRLVLLESGDWGVRIEQVTAPHEGARRNTKEE